MCIHGDTERRSNDKVNSFDEFNKNYSRITYLNSSEPDSRWAKSFEGLKVLCCVICPHPHPSLVSRSSRRM